MPARFGAGNPPAFLTGCSQAAVPGRSPALVRNYDWDYRLYDGVVMRTAYGDRRVLGMGDCLWGLLDGVNDAGIAVSLTFGGRPNVGTGFGIPIVLRYVLQTSDTIDAAVDALTRIPVHMSYNVTVLDAEGRHATVHRRPGQACSVLTDRAVTTNHQGTVEWKPYAAAIRSVERSDRLDALLAGGADTATVAVRRCASPCTRRNSTKASARSTPPSTVQARAARSTTGPSAPGSTQSTASPRRRCTCWSAMTATMPAPRSASTGCHTLVGFSGDRSCWRTDRGTSVRC